MKLDFHAYRWTKLEPVDAWFFRDGRPSNLGEDQSDRESEFPPNATTVVGAFRAALAREQGWNGRESWTDGLKEVLGNGYEDLGALSFLGPFLMKEIQGVDQLLWTLPRCVVGSTEGERFQPKGFLEPSEPVWSDISDHPVSLPCLSSAATFSKEIAGGKPPSYPEGMFVTSSGLQDILEGTLPEAEECIPSSELFTHETRVGILRDPDSRTTKQNALYNPRYVRLKRGVSLLQGTSGLPDDWKLPNLLPLGGEGRLACVTHLTQPPTLPAPKRVSTNLAISLLPGRFSDTWYGAAPGQPATQLLTELHGDICTVALDRPKLIGGWDSIKNQPRPMSPYADAGTVWWLEGTEQQESGMYQVGLHQSAGYGLILLSSKDRTTTPGTN